MAMTSTPHAPLVVGIVGAGMAGLTAARRLMQLTNHVHTQRSPAIQLQAGSPEVTAEKPPHRLSIVVFDKARGVGGRLSTRRVDSHSSAANTGGLNVTGVADTGAQFFTVRSDLMREAVDEWARAGVARVWTEHGFSDSQDGHARWVGVPAMNFIPKHMALQLQAMAGVSDSPSSVQLQLGARVSSLAVVGAPGGSSSGSGSSSDDCEGHRKRWRLSFEDQTREQIDVDALIITSPAPQTLDLLEGSGVASSLPSPLVSALKSITFDPCLAVVLVLDQPSALAKSQHPAAVQNFKDGVAGEPLVFVADNMEKGSSSVPCMTLHAGPSFSRQHYEDDSDTVIRLLQDSAHAMLGDAKVIGSYVHRWRYARPTSLCEEACLIAGSYGSAATIPPIAFCGDAFEHAAVEGAMLSGRCAGGRVAEALQLGFAET